MTPTSNILFKILSFSMLMIVADLAFAGEGDPGINVAVPEPGSLELLAIGAVGAVLYGLKSRKKD